MTPRERLLAVLHGQLPDRVPCDPDISNMVPCRLTGKPFWDIYAFEDPPLWKAHIHALNTFDLDGGFELYSFGPVDILDEQPRVTWEQRVVLRRPDGSFVTQAFHTESGQWAERVTLYTAANPPVGNLRPERFGLPPVPTEWEPLTGVKQWPIGMDLWLLVREELGDRGVLGMPSGMTTCMIANEEQVYQFHDDPRPFFERAERTIASVEQRMEKIARLPVKPDLLLCGGSGSLIWQTPKTFRELVLPVLKRTTELAAEIGIPTHVHSCGPEAELVRMAVEETALSIIDPLEVPPMGDCDLAELKRRYGNRIILKGNLHTTDVMLRGSPDDVMRASREAIEAAGAGGGFILSTGDQCGRDTPDANLHAMREACERYGRY